MRAKNRAEAWNMANEIFPTDYLISDKASNNAGYPVYMTTADGVNAWISDLGNRLELNLPDGRSINIWIDETDDDAQQLVKDAEAVKKVEKMVSPLFAPEAFTKITLYVNGYKWNTEAERAAYKALTGELGTTLALDLVAGYLDRAGIRWSLITDQRVQRYGTDDSGHVIVSAYYKEA